MSDCDCTKIGYTYEGGAPEGYRESPCSPCGETCKDWHFPVSGFDGNCPEGDCPEEGSISASKSGWSGEVPIGVISVTNKSGMAHANYYLQCGADTSHHYWYYLYASIEPIYKFSASFGGGREQEEPVLKYRVGASVLTHNAFGEDEGTGVYLLAIDNDGNFQRVGSGVATLPAGGVTIVNKFDDSHLSGQFPDLGPAPQGVPSSPRLPTGLTAAQIGYATYDIRCYDYQSGQSANAYSSEIVRSQRSVYEALDGYVKSGKGDNWRLADLTDLFGVEAVVSNTSTPIETHVGNSMYRHGPPSYKTGDNILWPNLSNKIYTGLDESWIGAKFIHSDYTLGKNGCLKDFQCSFDNEALTWNVAEVNNGGMSQDENGFYVKGTYDSNLYARGLLHCRGLKEFYTSKNKELKAEKTGTLVDLFVRSYRDHFNADIPSEQTLAETSGHLVKWITDPASYYGISEEEYEITRCCSGGSIITGYVTGGTTHSCGPFQTLRATGEDVWGATLYETGCPWPVEEITSFSDNCTGLIEGYVNGSLYFQDASGGEANKTNDWQWKYHWSMLENTGLGNIIDTESGHTHETGSQYLKNAGFEKTWTEEASGIFCYEVFVQTGKSSPTGELVLHYSGNSGVLPDGSIPGSSANSSSASSIWGTAGKTYIKNLASPSGNCCGECDSKVPIKICYNRWEYPGGVDTEKYHAGYPSIKDACTSKCESGIDSAGNPSGGHFTGWFIDTPLSNRGYETIGDKNIPKVNSTVYSGSGDNGVVKIWDSDLHQHFYVEDDKYIKIDSNGKVTKSGLCPDGYEKEFIANGKASNWESSVYSCRYPNGNDLWARIIFTGDGEEVLIEHEGCSDFYMPAVGTEVKVATLVEGGIEELDGEIEDVVMERFPEGDYYYGAACTQEPDMVGYFVKLNMTDGDPVREGDDTLHSAGVVTETGKCDTLFPRKEIVFYYPDWTEAGFVGWPSSGTLCSSEYGSEATAHSEHGHWPALKTAHGWTTGFKDVDGITLPISMTSDSLEIGANYAHIYTTEHGDVMLFDSDSNGHWYRAIGTTGCYAIQISSAYETEGRFSRAKETGACDEACVEKEVDLVSTLIYSSSTGEWHDSSKPCYEVLAETPYHEIRDGIIYWERNGEEQEIEVSAAAGYSDLTCKITLPSVGTKIINGEGLWLPEETGTDGVITPSGGYYGVKCSVEEEGETLGDLPYLEEGDTPQYYIKIDNIYNMSPPGRLDSPQPSGTVSETGICAVYHQIVFLAPGIWTDTDKQGFPDLESLCSDYSLGEGNLWCDGENRNVEGFGYEGWGCWQSLRPFTGYCTGVETIATDTLWDGTLGTKIKIPIPSPENIIFDNPSGDIIGGGHLFGANQFNSYMTLELQKNHGDPQPNDQRSYYLKVGDGYSAFQETGSCSTSIYVPGV